MVELLTPSINEQKAIANFLDQKTAEIDQLIADKEKLIELLQEKRQAIITEAVTKGLNPNDIQLQIQKLKEYRQSLIFEAVTGKIDVRKYERGDL